MKKKRNIVNLFICILLNGRMSSINVLNNFQSKFILFILVYYLILMENGFDL
jgi:hypothetical protein